MSNNESQISADRVQLEPAQLVKDPPQSGMFLKTGLEKEQTTIRRILAAEGIEVEMDQKINKISGSATKIPNQKSQLLSKPRQAGNHKKTNSNMLAVALNNAHSPRRKHQLMVWDVKMLPMLFGND